MRSEVLGMCSDGLLLVDFCLDLDEDGSDLSLCGGEL